MTINWESHDIVAGRVIARGGCDGSYMIGLIKRSPDECLYVVIDLTNGHVFGEFVAEESMAKYLSSAYYWPIELLSKSKKPEAAK